MVKEPSGWRDPVVTHLEDDDCAVIFSDDGPDGSHSVMRVWFEPDDDYRVRSVKLSMPGRITPTELRRFPWDRWLELADWNVRLPNMRPSDPPLVPKNDASPAEASKPAPGRPGRRGHPDEHYREVAERYRQLRAEGVTNPTATIAAERFANHNTVAGWLRGARERGYLPPGRRGRLI
jgi:hypothetical protein